MSSTSFLSTRLDDIRTACFKLCQLDHDEEKKLFAKGGGGIFSNKDVEAKRKRIIKSIDTLYSSIWIKYVYISHTNFYSHDLLSVLSISIECKQCYFDLTHHMDSVGDLTKQKRAKSDVVGRLRWLSETMRRLEELATELKIRHTQKLNLNNMSSANSTGNVSSYTNKPVAPIVEAPIVLLEERLSPFSPPERDILHVKFPSLRDIRASFHQLQQLDFDDTMILLWITSEIGAAVVSIIQMDENSSESSGKDKDKDNHHNLSISLHDFLTPLLSVFDSARSCSWSMLSSYHNISLQQIISGGGGPSAGGMGGGTKVTPTSPMTGPVKQGHGPTISVNTNTASISPSAPSSSSSSSSKGLSPPSTPHNRHVSQLDLSSDVDQAMTSLHECPLSAYWYYGKDHKDNKEGEDVILYGKKENFKPEMFYWYGDKQTEDASRSIMIRNIKIIVVGKRSEVTSTSTTHKYHHFSFLLDHQHASYEYDFAAKTMEERTNLLYNLQKLMKGMGVKFTVQSVEEDKESNGNSNYNSISANGAVASPSPPPPTPPPPPPFHSPSSSSSSFSSPSPPTPPPTTLPSSTSFPPPPLPSRSSASLPSSATFSPTATSSARSSINVGTNGALIGGKKGSIIMPPSSSFSPSSSSSAAPPLPSSPPNISSPSSSSSSPSVSVARPVIPPRPASPRHSPSPPPSFPSSPPSASLSNDESSSSSASSSSSSSSDPAPPPLLSSSKTAMATSIGMRMCQMPGCKNVKVAGKQQYCAEHLKVVTNF